MAPLRRDHDLRARAKSALLAAADVQLEYLLARAVTASHVTGEILYKSIAVDAVTGIALRLLDVGIGQMILSNPSLATVFSVAVFEPTDRGAQILKPPSADPTLTFIDKPDSLQIVIDGP